MNSELLNPTHPIWPLARLFVTMVALTGVLYFTANHFDGTEIRTIVTMFLVHSSMEGGLTKFLSQKKASNG